MKGIGLAFLSMGSLLAGPNFDPVVRPVMEILDAILWAALGLIGAVGAIYCIVLGIRLSKIDEQNSRQQAKKDLIGAIIGFLSIFVLIVVLKIALPILISWVESQT